MFSSQEVYDPQVRGLWLKLLDWLSLHAPVYVDTLRPGADETRISYMEAGFGCRFPAQVRTFFSLQQGQTDKAPGGLLFDWALMGFDEILAEWQAMGNSLHQCDPDWEEWVEFEGPVARQYACREWIPFATDFAGDLLCFDLAPGPEGQVGQILEVGLETERRQVLAPDLASYLGLLLHQLENEEWHPLEESAPQLDITLAPAAPGTRLEGGRLAELGLSLCFVEPTEVGAEGGLAFSVDGNEERLQAYAICGPGGTPLPQIAKSFRIGGSSFYWLKTDEPMPPGSILQLGLTQKA